MSVAALALILPVELLATAPVLTWAYRNGEPGLLFPIVRLGVSFGQCSQIASVAKLVTNVVAAIDATRQTAQSAP